MILIIGMVVVLAILGFFIMKKQSSQVEVTPSVTKTESVMEKSSEAGASGSMQKVSASGTNDPIDQELNALNKELDGVSSNDFKAGVSDDATLGF